MNWIKDTQGLIDYYARSNEQSSRESVRYILCAINLWTDYACTRLSTWKYVANEVKAKLIIVSAPAGTLPLIAAYPFTTNITTKVQNVLDLKIE